jgi:hypothetical protein
VALAAQVGPSLALLRANYGRGYIAGLARSWQSWDAFADYHHLDADAPTDEQLVSDPCRQR